MKREAAFTSTFRHWLHANPMRQSCCFELKQTRTDSLAFSSVQEHQIEALWAAQSFNGVIHKISDESRQTKPFDIAYFRYAKAYVVIKYPDFFCLIHINEFTNEKKSSTRKSLTSNRAREIAETVVELKKTRPSKVA